MLIPIRVVTHVSEQTDCNLLTSLTTSLIAICLFNYKLCCASQNPGACVYAISTEQDTHALTINLIL